MLVKEGHVSEAQLRHAVRVQKKLDTPQPILAILRQQGVVGDGEIRSSLRANPQAMRLGSLRAHQATLEHNDVIFVSPTLHGCKCQYERGMPRSWFAT